MKNFKYYSKNIKLPLSSLQIWGLSCQNEVMILEIFGFWHPNLSILVWSDLWLTGRCNAVPKVSLTDCKSHLPLWKKKKKKEKSWNDWKQNIQWMLCECWWSPKAEHYSTVFQKVFFRSWTSSYLSCVGMQLPGTVSRSCLWAMTRAVESSHPCKALLQERPQLLGWEMVCSKPHSRG